VISPERNMVSKIVSTISEAPTTYRGKRAAFRQYASVSMLLLFGAISFSDASLAQEHRIGMEGWEFNPASLTIQADDVVTWLNDDDTNHNIAFEIEFDTAPTRTAPVKVRKTKEYSLVFKEKGTFHYVCKIHEDYDMKGTITVE